jgi:hypothetical protein
LQIPRNFQVAPAIRDALEYRLLFRSEGSRPKKVMFRFCFRTGMGRWGRSAGRNGNDVQDRTQESAPSRFEEKKPLLFLAELRPQQHGVQFQRRQLAEGLEKIRGMHLFRTKRGGGASVFSVLAAIHQEQSALALASPSAIASGLASMFGHRVAVARMHQPASRWARASCTILRNRRASS